MPVSSDKYQYSWLSDDVIYFKYKDNAEIKLKDVRNMLSQQQAIGVSDQTKRIVHAGKYTTITAPAREHIETFKPKVKAEAFILNNLPQKILFNFYYKIRRSQNPIRSFTNLKDALNWLETI